VVLQVVRVLEVFLDLGGRSLARSSSAVQFLDRDTVCNNQRHRTGHMFSDKRRDNYRKVPTCQQVELPKLSLPLESCLCELELVEGLGWMR